VEKWAILDRMVSQFKFKKRPFSIINPIFQYSNIPACFMQVITKAVNKNALVPACPG